MSENESCIYGYASHMNLDIDGSYKLDATKWIENKQGSAPSPTITPGRWIEVTISYEN